MEILKFGNGAPAPRKSAPKKSNLKSLAGLATVAAVAVLGSTLAANISLGSGTLEFGQGVQVTAACDESITLSPKVSFVNTAGGGVFMFSTVSFSNVDGRAASSPSSNGGTGCQGKTLQLNAYGDSSATPIAFASASGVGISLATIGINGSTPTVSTGFTVANTANLSAATSSFDLGITTPNATSGAVYKLTLQSN